MHLAGTEDATISPFSGQDVATFLVERAAAFADRDLLIWVPVDGPEQRWTYKRFLHDVSRLAGGLAEHGIRPGDRVLVHLENSPEALLARFACCWLGAICVATNPMLTGPELESIAGAVGVRGAITQPDLAEVVSKHVSGLEWIAVTANPSSSGLPAHHADSFASLYGQPLPQRSPGPLQPALILFTTGTTARPKPVLWTHENFLWAACLGACQQSIVSTDVLQLYLPLYHVVGFSWTLLPVMWVGGTVVLQPRFSVKRYWPIALRHRTTLTAHVPFTITALQSVERPSEHFFRQWIANRQMPAEQAHFGIEHFSSAWGMTEMVSQPIIGNALAGRLPPGAIGRPSIGYRVRIADGSGRDVDTGASGELLVRGIRGRSIFLEYFGDPDATQSAFDERGFFRTGDRVQLNPDGSISFVDRMKDVIKVGGEGVAASEIEAVIQKVPGVREVAVVAGPDPIRTEIPVAFVVRTKDPDVTDDQLRLAIESECSRSLARFKVPRHVLFINELPRVGFGKISKARLRDIVAESLGKPPLAGRS